MSSIIVVSLLIEMIFPHTTFAFILSSKQRKDIGSCVNSKKSAGFFRDAYLGYTTDFAICSARISHALIYGFMLGLGTPLMTVFCTGFLFIFGWSQQKNFLKESAVPKRLDARITYSQIRIMYFALAARLFFSMFSLSTTAAGPNPGKNIISFELLSELKVTSPTIVATVGLWSTVPIHLMLFLVGLLALLVFCIIQSVRGCKQKKNWLQLEIERCALNTEADELTNNYLLHREKINMYSLASYSLWKNPRYLSLKCFFATVHVSKLGPPRRGARQESSQRQERATRPRRPPGSQAEPGSPAFEQRSPVGQGRPAQPGGGSGRRRRPEEDSCHDTVGTGELPEGTISRLEQGAHCQPPPSR